MELTGEALRFVYENIDTSCVTLETGCGLSTVVFALTGAHHVVIAPIAQELDYLKQYCSAHGISTERVRFIVGGSQVILPTLETPPLDLVLIDGCHGFPAPYIDWFYTAGALKIGGHVIVDDTWLWSCQILRDFLAAQPQWELVAEHEDRTAMFKKLEDGAETLEWVHQPLVASSGRMKWIDGRRVYKRPFGSSAIGRAVSDLRKGDFKTLKEKIGRRFSRFRSPATTRR